MLPDEAVKWKEKGIFIKKKRHSDKPGFVVG